MALLTIHNLIRSMRQTFASATCMLDCRLGTSPGGVAVQGREDQTGGAIGMEFVSHEGGL